MNMRILGASLLAVGALSLSATSASAAAFSSTTCNVNSVTADGFGAATACKGSFEGNDTGNNGELLSDLNGGLFANVVGDLEWSLLGKSDQNGSGVLADNDSTKGVWSVLEAITGPFVISLKAGDFYSAYLFNSSKAITSGTFNTFSVAVNQNNGKSPALSHASIFVANPGNPPVDVPEPATLMALGMVAIGGLGALKKKQA